MRVLAYVGLVASLGVSGPAAAQSAATADFETGGVRFTLPLPQGFCLPSGGGVAAAEQLAAGDERNLTLLTLYPCGYQGDGAHDYYLIKIPKRAIGVTVDREQLLSAIAAENAKPASAADPRMAPAGRDEMCVYLTGRFQLEVRGKPRSRVMGSCLTVAGGRVVAIYRYGDGATADEAKALLPMARAVADSITVRPAP